MPFLSSPAPCTCKAGLRNVRDKQLLNVGAVELKKIMGFIDVI